MAYIVQFLTINVLSNTIIIPNYTSTVNLLLRQLADFKQNMLPVTGNDKLHYAADTAKSGINVR